MKKLIMIFSIALLVISCRKEEQDNPAVEEFVTMLKQGTYNSMFLPDFVPGDIELLLANASNFQVIDYFPVNPISSYMPQDFRLGECLLWTVESIRLHYDETSRFAKFPSLVPQLLIPGGTMEQERASTDDLTRAYNLYLTWWTTNKTSDFGEFRSTNPLHGAGLIWR